LLLFIQKKLINKGILNTASVRIVKKFYIDRNLTLNIIKVLDNYYLVLTNNNSISFLDKIDYDDLSELLKGKKEFFDTFIGALKREKNIDEIE
jgi:flagellar protein FliO/FliZ